MSPRARRARLRVLVAIAFGLGARLGPSPAWAQDEAPATALRAQAQEKLDAGSVDEACGLFEQAYQAAQTTTAAGEPTPDEVLFDLASCHERQGKTTLAKSEFEQVAAGAGPRAGEARERALALAPPPPPPPAPPPVDPIAPVPPAGPGPEVDPLPPPAAPPAEESPTRVGDFMDTRLTWTFGDDDVIHQTGQAFPLSPDASIGDRRQYRLFFDNLNSRFGGRENLTHLVLYKKMPGFIERLDTEASLVVRLNLDDLSSGNASLGRTLRDSGSFIRAFYRTGDKRDEGEGIGLTLFPIDTDRMRLGYLYDISWGGTNASINQSIFPRIVGSSPGLRVGYDHERFDVYVGFKTANIVQVEETLTPGTSEVEQIRIGQTNYGFLGGGGVDIIDYIRLDLGGGYFQQGKFDLPDVAGEPVYTVGASARLAVHHPDFPVGQSIDFSLYRNDPNKPQIIFKPASYTEGKTTWAVTVEGSNLFQNLKSFETAGATELQSARAAALQANLQSGFARASLTGIYRDLPFVLRNQPSFIPFQTIPDNAETQDELFFAVAADYYFEGPRLTPGIGGGLQIPATFRTISEDSSNAPIERTVVVRQQGDIAILPVNTDAQPIIQARASLKWDVSRILSAIVWAQVVNDNNATFVERDPNDGTVALRTFVSPTYFGFGSSVQARF